MKSALIADSAHDNSSEFHLKNMSYDGDYLEEYDYDLNDTCRVPWEELTPAVAVYSLTFVLGIVGNSLIVFTIFRYRRMKSTTNVFLASLASADLLLIIICIPLKIAKLFSYTWTMGVFLCKMVHYMQNVSAICSVLTLTAMSIERYYAIVHPMKAKYICTISQARKIIIGTWLASLLLGAPIMFIQDHIEVGAKIKGYWCVRDYVNNREWVTAYELYMLILILIIPTSIMGITYSSICWEIWRVMKQRKTMTSGKATLTTETFPLSSKRSTCSIKTTAKSCIRTTDEENGTVRQVIKMLVMIVIVFVICWGPLLVDNVLTAFGVLPDQKSGTLKHMYTGFTLMAYFNSCVNPIVYGFMSKNFRESFQKALCRCCRGPPKRTLSMSQTRTTSIRQSF
ncbi:QRFP-like peptide receptor [Nilaparvata lugens]|uniref:Neuropeptide GPCR A42 n=1 Tax=Nilaparvata lugens TaxID=108931 RepID=U3U8Z9_NILLU|nr:QRFP-like peptide receptor [Nilaparvata lugens]BAO01092.1 neuropeptide GPCR A42 [Nilaparvata lugens]